MRPQGTAQQLERRRRQAIRLLRAGKNLSAVARAVSASVSSVFRWYKSYRKKGLKGLRPHPTPGRPPKLSASQKKRLTTLLLKGPLAAGYRTDLWTLQRVAQMIRRQWGVASHPCHVWKLLNSLGWSCQKPERRALQRDDAAIAHWKRSRWPHIKKRSTTWGPSGLPR
ncbi:MAG: IS630 family transposase [Desulfomonile tiedjei]|nr:IS630 family transposase [Desulfomonile tiedjei]